LEGARQNVADCLVERLARRAAETHDTAQLLAALAELDSAEAAGQMLEKEPWIRRQVESDVVSRLARRLVGGADAEDGATFVELANRYCDMIDGDSLAAFVSHLPLERRPAMARALSQVLTREPRHAGLIRAALEDAIQSGDHQTAHQLLTRLGRADTSQANLSYVWRKRSALPATNNPPVRVALLSSFTIDPLMHYLDVECRGLGLEARFYVAPFNSWAQEVLGEDSGLRQFAPEITFLSVSIDDLVPALTGSVQVERLLEAGAGALDPVVTVMQRFADWSDAVLVVNSFHTAFRDPNGILQGRFGPSRSAWLGRLNARLAEEARSLKRTYVLEMGEILQHRAGAAVDVPKMRHIAAMRLCGPVLAELGRAYAGYIAPLKGLTRKCLVVDLDNTLWGGIVGEDGAHGIKLGEASPGSEYQEFQRYLLSLTERGFLLAINSKNNPEDALEVIRTHDGMILREDAFSAMQINWLPKPENMLSIAEALNIGVDSLVFIDDNPHERELMRQALPQVLTPELPADPSLYRSVIEALPQLQKLLVTEEDRTRTQQYRAKRRREETRIGAASLEDYLCSLGITVQIYPPDEGSLSRIHQLFERTNQFNLTTRRYSVGELTAAASNPRDRLYALRARDRFGDHGIVGTALVRASEDSWTVDSFLLSCRVIGHGVETALLAKITDEAQAAGAAELVGEFIETAKNAPARDFYSRHGFQEIGNDQGVIRWRLTLEEGGVSFPEWVRMEQPDVS
jgi:FkbH-like protein